jgi:hypothetical protein
MQPKQNSGGKKNRSGPPGNLNGTRHPWRVFWRRRALQDQYRYLLPLIEKYSADLVADKGGPDNVSAAEKRMIEIAQTARACSMLILAEGHKRGLIKPINANDWDLTQGFKEMNRYLNTERTALQALGLERRKKVKSLTDLLREEVALAGELDADEADAEDADTTTCSGKED